MTEFNKHNKTTRLYWLKKSIKDINIKIKLKSQNEITRIPSFEDYTNSSNSVNLHQLDCPKIEEFSFKWQEKVFNLSDVQVYSDIHNCLNDTELSYNDLIKNFDYEPSRVFTYIHEDYHLPLPSDFNHEMVTKAGILNLSACFAKLELEVKNGRILGENSNSKMQLFQGDETSDLEHQWTAMHVVLDNSEYNDESEIVMKQEAILLSLYHNATKNCLLASPDVNDLDINPYEVKSAAGVHWGHQYAVELEFGDADDEDDLLELLKKLQKKWHLKHKHLLNFTKPPLRQSQYTVTLEIVSASDFEMDDLYVEYVIEIPEEIQCKGNLRGCTHITKALRTNNLEQWHFGHLIDLTLEVSDGLDPPAIKVFYEVISVDWWNRHRTEGYCYQSILLNPGRSTKLCRCCRPEELNSVEANTRRFFVGGCHLIQDLSFLSEPRQQNANIKLVTTGAIDVRWDILSQTFTPRHLSKASQYPGTSSASAVLMGAEAVLRHYREARARLAAATEDLTDDSGDG